MTDDEGTSIKQIQQAIREAGESWVAGTTTVSELPLKDQRLRLGLTPPPGELTIEQAAASSREKPLVTIQSRQAGAPSAFDLRNVGGRNFITPVKDQGGCGSCVAFGTLAAVEGTFRRQRNDPDLDVDLSEAQLFYCVARSEGRTCGTGWWPKNALDALAGQGIADESCYPYTAGDQNCTNLCSNWQGRATRITGHHQVSDVATIKEHIYTKGPVAACFVVYQDFFSYQGGVYRHVSGNQVGGHCVALVGYDDAQQCWIAKNSWGTGWGEAGFFKIGYGQCGIETWGSFAVHGIEETSWLNNRRVVGLWTRNQDRNSWVYLDGGIGWRKLAPDTDNVHIDMVTQMTTAKAANRPVNAYQQEGVIKQVYVL